MIGHISEVLYINSTRFTCYCNICIDKQQESMSWDELPPANIWCLNT